MSETPPEEQEPEPLPVPEVVQPKVKYDHDRPYDTGFRFAPEPTGPRFLAEEVREGYLSDKETGVATALRGALKSLFSEQRLPDNPYYYLANILYAYIDQSQLWKQPDDTITSAYDMEGGLELVYPESKLCTLQGTKLCYGLPHVLRAVSKDATTILHDVLVENLPETFFPSSLPFSTEDGYTVQVMASVQGTTAVWRPQSTEFPELDVRCDVLIRGPKLQEALKLFIDLILTEVEELHSVPVHFVDGIAFLDAASNLVEGDKEPLHSWWPLEDVLSKPKEFETMGLRMVMGDKLIRTSVVVLLETPDMAEHMDEKTIRYELAHKTYVFHYASELDSKPGYDQLTHYGGLPFEALYGGYFLYLSAAQQYLAMYEADGLDPYAVQHLSANETSMKRQIERRLAAVDSLKAFQQLVMLMLLQDMRTTRPGELRPRDLLDLEQLVQMGKRTRDGREELLAALPNVFRILASAAAVIEGCVRELQAISIAAVRWPPKLAAIMAGSLQAKVPGSRGNQVTFAETPPGSADSRATLATPQVSSALVVWLRTFDLEARLLTQLLQLRTRVRGVIGRELFSGISILIDNILKGLPDAVPLKGSAAIMVAIRPKVVLLEQLLHAAALTVAHGFLGRCTNVQYALLRLGIEVHNIGERQVATGPAFEDELYMPDWVLDVHTVMESQVRSGGLAERVAAEGVMLQYAVDSQLDEMVSTLWMQLTQPPMVLNPYPRLMHLIRARAAKMELWQDDRDDALNGSLLNELAMVRSPAPIYVAHRRVRPRRAGLLSQQQNVKDKDTDEDDVMVAYGCYAAVALADPVAVQGLRSGLLAVLADRTWQQGAYQVDVVPCLVGSAAFSNAFRLDEVLGVPANYAPGKRITTIAPYEHPRFYGVESEEHHLVCGPHRQAALEAFAKQIVESTETLHRNSIHSVHSINVNGNTYDGGTWDDPVRVAALTADLVESAKETTEGMMVGSIRFYIAARNSFYVVVTRHLVFQFKPVTPTLAINVSLVNRVGPAKRPTTADRAKLYWDRAAYVRVFLSEQNAMLWHAWNRDRGDPCQPYHYQRMCEQTSTEIESLRVLGNILDLQRLELICAIAAQDGGKIYQFSRCCLSTSQELRVLQEMNIALVELTSEKNDVAFTAQLSHEHIRKLFLTYYSRMRKAMVSPKYNYFMGLATKAPKYLNHLREIVLSSFKMESKELDMMEQLNIWTMSCEISVAAAVFDCLEDDVAAPEDTVVAEAPAVEWRPASLVASLQE